MADHETIRHRLTYRGAELSVIVDTDLPSEFVQPLLDKELARLKVATDAAWESNGGEPPWVNGIDVDSFMDYA